jgi:hypothetical protein
MSQPDDSRPNLPAVLPTQDLKLMAEQVAKSRLFPGIESEQAAFTLMLLCQAESLHPATALRRYHIINGRPSMRADAMQAEFQRQGGVIRWVRSTEAECTARFLHDRHAPDPGVEITWTIKRATAAGLTNNPTWRKFPDQMLRARVISEGVRMVMPGIVAGIYTPEEVADFAPVPPSRPRHEDNLGAPPVDPLRPEVLPAPAHRTGAVPDTFDEWLDVGAGTLGIVRWRLLNRLTTRRAAELGSAVPEGNRAKTDALEALYRTTGGRRWLRDEFRAYREDLASRASVVAPTPDPDAEPDEAQTEDDAPDPDPQGDRE